MTDVPEPLPQVDLGCRIAPLALAACSDLAYRIAHDIGNIQTAVLGNLRLLTGLLDATASAQHDRCERIRQAMNPTATLHEHLSLFLGHPGSDDLTPLDAVALLQHDALAEHDTPGSPDVTSRVHYAVDSNLPRPAVYLPRLKHALRALLANAADASIDRGGRVRVTARAISLSADDLARTARHPEAVPGLYVCLAVEDQGEGIPEHVFSRLFDPGFSTRMRQPGFGLSDVYGIVCRQHGGAIALWTAEGRGTRIALLIPAQRQPAARPV